RINTLNDFWSHYRACTSLLFNELQIFKEKEQLNQDNLIVLDNTSLQAIAHYIISIVEEDEEDEEDEENGMFDDEDEISSPRVTIDPFSSGDKESIKPRYFTSDTLMLYDRNQQQRVLAWHKEHNYPLHLKLNGFAESKFPEFVSYVQRYPRIILYFNELIYSDVEIWLTILMQLPASQIIGVCQGQHLSPRSIIALLNFINQLPQLEILSINLPEKYNTDDEDQPPINLANLNLSQKQQLNYLSIKQFQSFTLMLSNERTLSSATSQLNAEESSHFLNKLPRSLNYLYLPFTWTYSLPVLNEVLTKHLPCLKELGSTDDSDFSPNITQTIDSNSEKHHTISLPQVKIINKGQLVPIEGIEANQPYMPFAFDSSGRHTVFFNNLDFTPHYKSIRNQCEQPDMTLEKAIGCIDKIINENNLNDLRTLALLGDTSLELNAGLELNVELLLLIHTRLPQIKELAFYGWAIKKEVLIKSNTFMDEMKKLLTGHVWELDTLNFTVCIGAERDLLDNLFSRLNVKSHVLLATHFNDIVYAVASYFKDVQSLGFKFIEDAERCRSYFPNIVINRDYGCTNFQAAYDFSVDELQALLLKSQQSRQESDYRQATNSLINDTCTIENSSTRLSARQLFRTLEGQAVPVHYNRLSVRSRKNNALIKNGTTVHPGKIFRYDQDITNDARVYEATHCYDLNTNSNYQIIPMLHPQDTLYKITTSHPLELSYDIERKAYYIKSLIPHVPVTITYQFHSSALIENRMGPLHPNPKFIIPASKWINEFRPYFDLFNWINFTAEGIKGLDCLNALSADKLPFLICAYFADFGSGPLQLLNQFPSADEIDNAILHQKVGACRHRSNLAFKMLSALADIGMCAIEANLTTSDVHQFLELFINNEWVSVCLGGFNAQIDLQNTHVTNAEQATPQVLQLEEIGVGSLFALNQSASERYFPFEENIDGWEELYAKTEQHTWNSIIQGFDPYSDHLMDQSALFHNEDDFFITLEGNQEVQKAIQNKQPPENLFLLTYPKLSFTHSQDYRGWLAEQLEANNSGGGHLLLVVDFFDKHIAALQRDADEYISDNEGYFASISDFQHLKFAELQVNAQGNKAFLANRLGTLLAEGRQGDVLWINIKHYQAATINPLFDHRKKLRDKHIPDEVLLIAVMEEALFQEMSDDFTSRFSSIYKLDTHSFQPTLPQRAEMESIESSFVFGEPTLSFDHFSGYYAHHPGYPGMEK
ncbi:MAG: hypothetical protein M1486_04900, partial [Gammaproteobacteria bacterium]|nr:hypothetical protein [Gammaproteobacteria bacterium]